jgi:hypothetical protein
MPYHWGRFHHDGNLPSWPNLEMKMNTTSHYIALDSSILLVPGMQILLKLGANRRNGRSKTFQPHTLTGLGILIFHFESGFTSS